MSLIFFLSLIGSFKALRTNEAAAGRTVTVVCLFWTIISTGILIPFHAAVAFLMSSPTFLGGIPRGPHFGARTAAATSSPPMTLRKTIEEKIGIGCLRIACYLVMKEEQIGIVPKKTGTGRINTY